MPKPGTVEIYEYETGDWRWKVMPSKGNCLARGPDSHKTITKRHKSYLKFEALMKLGCKVEIKQ